MRQTSYFKKNTTQDKTSKHDGLRKQPLIALAVVFGLSAMSSLPALADQFGGNGGNGGGARGSGGGGGGGGG